MSRWIETICMKDGRLLNLSGHQERMNRTLRDHLGFQNSIVLEEILEPPQALNVGKVKCRLVYSHILHDISWTNYRIREISSVRLVHNNELDYSTKKEDRSAFAQMIQAAGTDDVIVVKQGLITDSSYANLIFRRGTAWITPSTPLLAGTMRTRLLRQGAISQELIRPRDLADFEGFKYINAMLSLEDSPELPMHIIEHNKKAGY